MGLDNLRTGLTFDDVLLVPRRSTIRSRSHVSLTTWLSRNIELAIPVIAANMDTVCEDAMAKELARLGGIGILHRFLPVEAQVAMAEKVKTADPSYRVGAAVGTDHDMVDRARALADVGVDVLVLDIAHGHADHALHGVEALKAAVPSVDVIAGNVATRQGALDLVSAGADAVKVGVGPGGVCTTRLVAGVGVPQLTAIADCAGCGVPLIADGGIRTSGDIAKALAAGADTVMIGSMFAGTKESPGEVEATNSGLMKRVRGMASFEAVTARAVRSGEEVDDEYLEQRAPEGVEGMVPYKGDVDKLVWRLMAGVKSAMSYSDAHSIVEFWANAEFIRITPLGLRENQPHATFS